MSSATPPVDIGDVVLRLIAAVVVGMVIGLDREWRGKPVGLRTLGLVSLGSALVCVSTVHFFTVESHADAVSRVIQGVIQGVMTGVGFLGAGAIIKGERDQHAHSLTTAATVWVTAALGIACALATWSVVLTGVALTLIVLVVMLPIDRWFDKKRAEISEPPQ
jgi:putative Mg2+ transporter-C (MgtC) family protein